MVGLARLICNGRMYVGGQPKNLIKTSIFSNFLFMCVLIINATVFVSN